MNGVRPGTKTSRVLENITLNKTKQKHKNSFTQLSRASVSNKLFFKSFQAVTSYSVFLTATWNSIIFNVTWPVEKIWGDKDREWLRSAVEGWKCASAHVPLSALTDIGDSFQMLLKISGEKKKKKKKRKL